MQQKVRVTTHTSLHALQYISISKYSRARAKIEEHPTMAGKFNPVYQKDLTPNSKRLLGRMFIDYTFAKGFKA
jgi:hypothetical protein